MHNNVNNVNIAWLLLFLFDSRAEMMVSQHTMYLMFGKET